MLTAQQREANAAKFVFKFVLIAALLWGALYAIAQWKGWGDKYMQLVSECTTTGGVWVSRAQGPYGGVCVTPHQPKGKQWTGN